MKTMKLIILTVLTLALMLNACGKQKATAVRGESTSDFPESYADYEHGGKTYLNTLRLHVEYFIGLRRIFKSEWDPVSVLEPYLNEKGRSSMQGKSLKTVIGIEIDKGGEFKSAIVIQSSGLTNYDLEALKMVRKVGKYLPPDKGYLTDDGVLRLAWTFVVYM